MEKTFFLSYFSFLVLFFICFAPGILCSETVILKSGKKIEAKVLGSTDKSVKIKYGSKNLYYNLDLIKSIEGVRPEVFFLEKLYPCFDRNKHFFKDIDYGIDTDLNNIIISLQRTLSGENSLLKIKSAEEVFFDLTLGAIGNRYELILPDRPFSPEYGYEQALREKLSLMALDPYALRFYSSRSVFPPFFHNIVSRLNNKTKIENYNDPKKVYDLGVSYYFQGDHVQAASFFEKLAALDKENAEAHCFLGLIYYGRGEYKKGKAFLRKACRFFRIKKKENGVLMVSSFLSNLP